MPEQNLDELDIRLLEILQENCKLNFTQIGHELGIAESTVRYRIERLEKRGIITNATHGWRNVSRRSRGDTDSFAVNWAILENSELAFFISIGFVFKSFVIAVLFLRWGFATFVDIFFLLFFSFSWIIKLFFKKNSYNSKNNFSSYPLNLFIQK